VDQSGKFFQVGKMCGKEWAAIDAMSMKKYEAMNAEDRKRHIKEMAAYEAELSLPPATTHSVRSFPSITKNFFQHVSHKPTQPTAAPHSN
jgi:hypothetical protein